MRSRATARMSAIESMCRILNVSSRTMHVLLKKLGYINVFSAGSLRVQTPLKFD